MKAGTPEIKISVLSYNLNGVLNKFEEENLANYLRKFDLLVITETHFKIRYKSPGGFNCISRSEPLNICQKGRGGVIIYKNKNFHTQVDLVNINLLHNWYVYSS